MDAERLIPHRLPLRLVDRLVSFSADSATVEATMAGTNLLTDENGPIDPLISLELMAQSYAVAKGYKDRIEGQQPKKGFLVGVRRYRAFEAPSLEAKLTITVRTVAVFAGFAVVEAVVAEGERQIATGTIKLWIPDDSPAPVHAS